MNFHPNTVLPAYLRSGSWSNQTMFSEVDLFHDCAVKHSEIAPNQALGEHTYAAVWSALRAWLVSLFARCRGGVFPTFARIAWHRVGDQLEDGVPQLRPIFVPCDAYLRAHLLHTGSGVTRMNSIVADEMEPCEEYSAMKIAIKHSCSLNKDIVFCCTRHLLQHLGEALSSGRPLALDVGVGVLTGRDRCLSFRFHSQYLAHWPMMTAAMKLSAHAPSSRPKRQPTTGNLSSPSEQQEPELEQDFQKEHQQRQRVEIKPEDGNVQSGWREKCDEQAVAKQPASVITHVEERGGSMRVKQRSAGRARERRGSGTGLDSVEHTECRDTNRHPGKGIQVKMHGFMHQQHQPALPCQSQALVDDRAQRSSSRDVGPPASPNLSRPAWGVRAPPQTPSLGRRSNTAVTTSPVPSRPKPAAFGQVDALTSSGGRGCSSDCITKPHQLHLESQRRRQHHHDAEPLRDWSTGIHIARANGGRCISGSDGGGGSGGGGCTVTARYDDGAMTVGHAIQLVVRAPRQQPDSPVLRAYGSIPHQHQHVQRQIDRIFGSQRAYSDGGAASPEARPVSGLRCRQRGAWVGAAEALPDQRRQSISPRIDGAASVRAAAAVAARPAWGSGYGARVHASTGNSPGAMRPRSAPKMRPAVTGAERVHEAAQATAAGPPDGSGLALVADSGCGGVGVGVQLWSPDSKLTIAAGSRCTLGTARARRLFMDISITADSDDGSRYTPLRALQNGPTKLHNTLTKSGQADGARGRNRGGEVDDVSCDQRRQPQEGLLGQQKLQQKGSRKLGLTSPQRDGVRPWDVQPGGLGDEKQKKPGPRPQPQISCTRQPSATAVSAGCSGGGEEPDHSPQQQRDQRRKPVHSPPSACKLSPATTAAATVMAGSQRRAIVRTISPRIETQHHNMRYGAPVAFPMDEGTPCTDTAAAKSDSHGVRTDAVLKAEAAHQDTGDTEAGGADPPLASRRPQFACNKLPLAGAPLQPQISATAPPIIAMPAVEAAGTCEWQPAGPGRKQPLMRAAASKGLLGVTAVPDRLIGVTKEEQQEGAVRDAAAATARQGVALRRGWPAVASEAREGSRGSSFSREGNGGGAKESPSSGRGEPCSRGAVDSGYPLPVYDSSIDEYGSKSGGVPPAAATTAALRLLMNWNHVGVPTAAVAASAADHVGSLTAAVQAALSSQRSSGRSLRLRSTRSSLLCLERPLQDPDLPFTGSPRTHRDTHTAPTIFPVPVVITERDLPQPAWGSALRIAHTKSDVTGRGVDRIGGTSGIPAYQCVVAEESPKEQKQLRQDWQSSLDNDLGHEEDGTEPDVVGQLSSLMACVASSGEICWSARSGRGGDSGTQGVRIGGRAMQHRRACGGALLESTEPLVNDCGGGKDDSWDRQLCNLTCSGRNEETAHTADGGRGFMCSYSDMNMKSCGGGGGCGTSSEDGIITGRHDIGATHAFGDLSRRTCAGRQHESNSSGKNSGSSDDGDDGDAYSRKAGWRQALHGGAAGTAAAAPPPWMSFIGAVTLQGDHQKCEKWPAEKTSTVNNGTFTRAGAASVYSMDCSLPLIGSRHIDDAEDEHTGYEEFNEREGDLDGGEGCCYAERRSESSSDKSMRDAKHDGRV